MKKAMILAAGLGTRLRPFSEHKPKALFTINERPVLAIAIEKLEKAGFDSVIVNTHHHHRQIEQFVADGTFGIPVQTRHEPEILGTGGGIRNIADFWESGSLLVANADIVSDINLAEVYQAHQSHEHPVTMVMHDHPQFNTVHVDASGFVRRFKAGVPKGEDRKMAFTGIHVLERRVLDFLPPGGPAHIITAYEMMIAAGEGIRALEVEGHSWYDIGTPQSYKTAVFDHMAHKAFISSSGSAPEGAIHRQLLQGDGSDRQWYRLKCRQQSLVMVDHGIRADIGPQEVDAFVAIGRHLAACDVAVPRIYGHDRHAGLVFNQDVGDTHLQALIKHSGPDDIRRLYGLAINQWVAMAVRAAEGFDTAWTYQTPRYDEQVVLDNECRYFTKAFLQGYLNRQTTYAELQAEFETLARNIMDNQVGGFVHRDFQSRNIMIRDHRIYIIDYQGGRLGPIQYDLASLLIDPYVNLSEELQSELLEAAIERLQNRLDLDRRRFMQGYQCCALSRNLQILGAFAYLSQSKGKKQFEAYIPVAAMRLRRNLSCLQGLSLPKLKNISEEIIENLKIKKNLLRSKI